MDRFDGANFVTIGGLRYYRDFDPSTNTPGSVPNALGLNGLQEEVMTVIERTGQTANPADNTQLWQGIEKQITAASRIRLLTNTTIYVNASTGNDTTGNGTIGAPLATKQKAINVLAGLYDMAGFDVTISCSGNGTDGAGVTGPLLGQTGANSLIFDGGGTAQVNVTNGTCFACSGGAQFTVQNFALLTTSGSSANGIGSVLTNNGGTILHSGNDFGACVNSHQSTDGLGALILATGNYTISGGAASSHAVGEGLCRVTTGVVTITLSGTPAFPGGFALGALGGLVDFSAAVFAGTGATGPHYSLFSGGIIQTSGGGPNFFPGSAVGTNDGTGIYQ